jgi:cytochrome c-type biogenesis protein CcmH/NrfG
MGEATTCSSPDLGHLCNNHLSLMSDRNLALALNPLHPDGWFALGSASLKARELDSAINAFTRSVQLNPENGESWNNLAAL